MLQAGITIYLMLVILKLLEVLAFSWWWLTVPALVVVAFLAWLSQLRI